MLGVRRTVSAPVTRQVSLALSPRAMVAGTAVKEATIGRGIDGSVTQAPTRMPVRAIALGGVLGTGTRRFTGRNLKVGGAVRKPLLLSLCADYAGGGAPRPGALLPIDCTRHNS